MLSVIEEIGETKVTVKKSQTKLNSHLLLRNSIFKPGGRKQNYIIIYD